LYQAKETATNRIAGQVQKTVEECMSIAQAVEDIQDKIEKACLRSGRKSGEVRLMAVSKFHDVPAIEQAWSAGIRLFGENRVQEAARKFPGFLKERTGTELHMIGSLQRNKARLAVSLFGCIQSVDRDELIAELGFLTQGREEPLMILLEYHTAEDSKSGYPDEDSLARAAEKALGYSGLRLGGLMTLAPFTDDQFRIRASFRALVKARDKLAGRFPGGWSCLSMGMTNDFEIAIEEGSTLVRIGTAIFGPRSVISAT
jgi:pyridoxal phosphate enzyme (YggS family)